VEKNLDNLEKCNNCDILIRREANFCFKCGFPVPGLKNICKECDTHCKEEDIFCYKCGSSALKPIEVIERHEKTE
jgi:hypothetical protein